MSIYSTNPGRRRGIAEDDQKIGVSRTVEALDPPGALGVFGLSR